METTREPCAPFFPARKSPKSVNAAKWTSAEAPDGAEAQHVELVVADAADFVVALPLGAQPERRHDVPLQAGAERQAVAGLFSAGTRQVRLQLRLAVVSAQLAVDAELVRDRPHAEGDQLPRARLVLHLETATGSFRLAEIVISDLGRNIGSELIPAEDTPGGVLLIAREARRQAGAGIFELRLPDRAADIERARVHLRRRRQRERGSGDCENCDC